MELQFAGFSFGVKGSSALLFKKLKFTGEAETEDTDKNSDKNVSYKTAKPLKVSFTAQLYAGLGIDVEKTALNMVAAGRNGKTGYLTANGRRIVGAQLMMTKAECDDLEIGPGGRWVSASVKITLEQCGDGSIGNGGGIVTYTDVARTIATAKSRKSTVGEST